MARAKRPNLQAILKKQIAQRQKAAKALIKARKPKKALRPKAKAQPVVPPPPKVPPVPMAQIAVREKGRAAPAINTTCDIYHSGNTPPAAADVAGVPCTLVARFREGGEASEGDSTFRWTHILFVGKDIDIRDNYPDAPDSRVYVPDKDSTGFDIVFVELVNRGDPTEYKRIFLDRRDPTWPTNQL
jgi:hypothetical protein